MKTESVLVQKLRITEIDGLDPITVVLEDIAPRKGKIIIECYGRAWSSYWGGMGDQSIAEFFCSCDEHYLAKNLSSTSNWVDDLDELIAMARREICKKRRDGEIEEWFDAREMYEKADCLDDGVYCNRDFMGKVFGDCWMHDLTIPHKDNPDYLYLCRIIRVVQESLKSVKIEKAA